MRTDMDRVGVPKGENVREAASSTDEAMGDHPGIPAPELEDVLQVVFGISTSELAVCQCVMELGETTTAGAAEALDVDRSLVSRHLNHLTNLGVLEKDRRLRRAGGDVYVYRPTDIERVREAFARGLRGWTAAAERQIASLSREKVAAIPADASTTEGEIFADD